MTRHFPGGSAGPSSTTSPGADGFDAKLDAEGRRPAPQRRIGIVTLLIALVLAVVVPTLGIGVAATWYAVSEQRAAAVGRLQDTARDVALALDHDLTGYTDVMLTFAASPAFAPAAGDLDLAAVDAQGKRIAQHLGISVGVVRPNGSRLTSSAIALGATMPPVASQKLIDHVVLSGQPAIGDIVVGSLSHDYSFTVAVPVLGNNGRDPLVVIAGIHTGKLEHLLTEAGIPDGAFAAIADASGTIVAFSDAARGNMVGQTMKDDSRRALQAGDHGAFRIRGRDGFQRVVAFHKLKAAPGWTSFVSQPAVAFDSAWRVPLVIFAIGSVAALGLGAVLALLTARPMLMTLRRLAEHASVVASSGGADNDLRITASSLTPTRVTELESVRLGFAAAEITMRRRADGERAAAMGLAEREGQLRALIQASPIGLGRCSFDGLVIEANTVLTGILGVTEEDIRAGQVRWADLTTPESRGVTEQRIAEALSAPNGQCQAYEKEFLRADGTRVPVLINMTVLDRDAREAAVFVLDLTEARQNDARLKELLSTIDMGAFMTRDPSGTIHHWSAGCERLYGWTAAEAIGHQAHDLLRTVFPIPSAEIEAALERDGAWEGDLRQATRFGDVVIVTAHKRLRRGVGDEAVVLELLSDVTAQRQAEAALAESNARLQAIGEVSPDLIYSQDLEGRIIYANPATLAIMRQQADGLFGTTEGAYDRDKATVSFNRTNDLRVLETGEAATFEEPITAVDGIRRVFRTTKAPLRDPVTGAMIGIACIGRDVTEQRAMEATRARLAAIVTSSFDAVISFAAEDGHILSWNRGAEALFGWTEAEAVGASVSLLVPEWLPEGDPTGVFRDVINGTAMREHETIRRSKSGEEIPISVTASRMEASDGRVLGVSGIFRDLRPRRAAEAALRESEARWRTLAETHPGFVFEADASGCGVYTNKRLQDYTGLPAEDLLGNGWLAVVHPDDVARVEAVWRAAIGTGSAYEAEHRMRSARGDYQWFLCRGMPRLEPDGSVKGWSGACADISEIVAARESAVRSNEELERLVLARTQELEITQERLAQAAKMEALGRLSSGVAHDFNNVLQAVQGSIGLALKRLTTHPDRVLHYLNIAREAAERGASVTGRLLAFAHRSALVAEPVVAEPMLTGLAQMLRPTLGPSVKLCIDVDPAVPPLFADRAQLETVLVNLANNARDALPDAIGSIRLSADRVAPPSHLPSGDYVRLSVADDGVGMPPEILSRVSEPFFTTKPRGAGTGLGLAMARGFAEQSKGTLEIESTVGRGTVVSIWLPAASPDGAASVAAAARLAGDPVWSVLVVDDEPTVRAVVRTVLEDLGHAVTEAADAASALAVVDSGLAVDALVTDLAMPGDLDGTGLINAARRRRPGLPAMLLTAHTGDACPAALEAAAAGGPFLVLSKPASAAMLEAKLGALMQP